jgi:HK97 family phage prohead protease
MPYFITDKNPECSGWAVVDDGDGYYGCHTTKESAIEQAVAISIADEEPFEGERAAVDSLNIGDYVSWNVLDPEVLAEIVAVEGQMAVVRVYDYEDGIFEPTDKYLIINVFKIERIVKPAMVAEKFEEIDEPAHDQIPMEPAIRKADGDPIIISDIDDTLLRNGTELIQKTWDYIQTLEGALFIVTGRPASTRSETEADLENAGISYSRLIMNDGSTADSAEFKKAKADELLQTYNVVAAIENDEKTLGYYRELGIEAINPSSIDETSSVRAIDQEAPAYMRAAARRGLQYYEDGLGGDGLQEQTINEARDMAEGRVTDDKWVRIAAWIARHLTDLDAPDADPSSENYPSPGVVAHLLWGSGPTKRSALRALDYAESVVARIDAENTNTEEETMNESVMDETRAKWLRAAYAIKAKLEGDTQEGRSLVKGEIRTNHVELRAEGDGMTFSGYASVFGVPSSPLPFTEIVQPGAFKRSLQSRNRIMMLWNHDTSNPLASTRNGSLQLVEDNYGLKVTATLPNTQLGRDLSELVRTSVIDSMSFGFSVKRDSWSKDGNTRYLEDVTLYEVSLVTSPAYEQTAGTVSVRSADGISADTLADALLRIESGEELDPEQGQLVADVISKLTKTPEVEEVNGDILALKQKKLALLMMGTN